MSPKPTHPAKESLLGALEREATRWAERRRDARDDRAWWEAKARWLLLLETRALVYAVPVSDGDDATRFAAAVVERIGSHGDWAFGNWPDDVQARSFAWVKAFLGSCLAEVLAQPDGPPRE